MKKQRSLQSEGFQAFGIYTMFRKPIKHSRRGVEEVGGEVIPKLTYNTADEDINVDLQDLDHLGNEYNWSKGEV